MEFKVYPKYNGGVAVSGAYTITHLTSGRIYVGSTGDLYKRKVRHESQLRLGTHDNSSLQVAYVESPELSFAAIPTSTREEAYEMEQRLLDILGPQGVLFNRAMDAKNAGIGWERTAEHIEKVRLSHLGSKRSEEARERMRAGSVGKGSGVAKSESHRANISKALAGYVRSPEHAAKIKRKAVERGLRQMRPVTFFGVTYPSLLDAAKQLNLTISAVRHRLRSESYPDCLYV